ncbi:hypothetical protein SpCBS45565_g02263 [Spizellomyces sp. 'palustris']|nr:hypothetical protein SpCBS45565_g02263 [Spizellomyces sp. 'palustris']
MDQTVLLNLSACLSHDPNTRIAAELRAKELQRLQPDYAQYLTQIALGPAFSPPERQLAAVSLKNYVDTHWSRKADDKFVGPEPPIEVKAAVKSMILPGIRDSNKRMRVLIAYVVSRIAHFDWPESWPDLFETLLADIRGGNADHVHGAMRVLAEFVRDDLTDQHFPYLAPALLPELHRIFGTEDSYSPRDRARALGMFRDFADIAYMVSDEHPEVIRNYVEPLLPTWMESFKKTLANINTTPESLPVKHEVLRTLCKLVKQFPKPMSQYTLQFLEPVWNHLVALQTQYRDERVTPTDELHETVDVDSDGEVLGFESLLYSLLEYVQLVARKKGLRHMFTVPIPGTQGPKQAGDFLKHLIGVVLTYLQITAEMEETWTNDMNQFIQDDEEEAMSYNVRIAVEELILALVESFPFETLQALCQAVQSQFQESTKARESGNKAWWKVHEACLLALGRLNGELIDHIRSQRLTFDLEGLFNHVVLSDMKCIDHPFLQGRALWFSSQFAEVLPSHLVSQYMGAAVEALGPNITSAAVKVDATQLVPFQAPIIEGILQLSESASEEALALLLETLGTVAKVNEEVTAQYENMISRLVLNVWVRGAEDFLLTEIIVDLFNVLAANKSMAVPFQEHMVPAVRDVLRLENVEKMPWAVATALTLMTALIKHIPEPFPPVYTNQVFPDLIQMLLVVDDHSILQNGQDTVKELVQRDLARIARWTDGQKTGLDYVIQFIAKLLHPSQSESASIFVGDLVTRLIQKGGNELTPVLPELLTAVARRLQAARTSSFIQQLVMVFAHLILNHPETVIDFLSQLDLNGKNGLELIIELWCEHFGDFQGFYSIKVSALAMSKLLLNGDTRLQALQVKGDEIVVSNKIITRSMTRQRPAQYSVIPFPAKAIKLLLVELQHQTESQMGRASRRGNPDDEEETTEGVDSDEEDVDWEDVDRIQRDDFLADLISKGGVVDVDATDYEGADEELWSNPIYQMDLKAYLAEFFQTSARENTQGFLQLCDGFLNEAEKERLRGIVG